MAAKLLQTLADDNPDLQKKIGCMNGIFQLFDRQQMVSGRRRLLPANPHLGGEVLDRVYDGSSLRQHADESHHFIHPSDRQRFSTESSRISISSSCSSSLSSLECSRSAQLESSPFNRAVSSEAPSTAPVTKQSGSPSPNLAYKSMDLRNAVKDSMNREAGRGGLQVKKKDSKKADGISRRVGIIDVNNDPADIKESPKVLAKLRESPRYYNDAGQLLRSSSVRDQSPLSSAKDAPRFSYDGKEQMQNHLSSESRETVKSSMKLKEFPRLSVDSREGSVQPLHSAVGRISSEKRPPSVVAKLMGLDALPEPSLAGDNAPVGLRKPKPTDTLRRSDSLGSSFKEPESPQWRNPDRTVRPVQRIPNEPAPWRQSDGNRVILKPGQKLVMVSPKTREYVPSVYGEIEKRLKDLEFKQSGKDLRALKQILEAIQAKGLLESRKEDQATNYGGDGNSLRSVSGTEWQQLERGNRSISSGSRESDDVTVFESPIVIMKPAKLVEKDGFVHSSMIPIEGLSNQHEFQGGVHADTWKGVADERKDRDQAPKTTRKNLTGPSDKKISSKDLKLNQMPSRPRVIPKETTSPPKKSSLASPRLHQRKLELERQSRPPTPPSDVNKPRRISYRQASEAAMPGGRHKIKHFNLNPSEDQMREVSIGSRTPSYRCNEVSVHSEGSSFRSAKFDIEFLGRCPSAGLVQFSDSKSMSKDVCSPLVDEDEVFTEFPTVALEHRSPVSVLDLAAHIEDDLASIKSIQNSSRESSALVLSYDRSKDIMDPNTYTTSTSSVQEIDRKKLQSIDKLVQKLRRVNSSHDEESTDYIASLCKNSNPDHRYISEIMLASGLLLQDLGPGSETFHFHSSGQPINPELFFVLEQTKSSRIANGVQTKVHRKLIFDSVNEILTEKLPEPGIMDDPWLMSAGNLARKTPTAQNLLKQLCAEKEHLNLKRPCSYSKQDDDYDCLKGILWEDAVCRAGSWTDFREEKSSLVLGIERLVFKDLVNEMLVGCRKRPTWAEHPSRAGDYSRPMSASAVDRPR